MTEHTCEDVLAELYLFLDGELDAETRHHVAEHLRQCAPCLEAFDFEADLKRMVAGKCHETAPDGLRSKIMDVLAIAELQRRNAGSD